MKFQDFNELKPTKNAYKSIMAMDIHLLQKDRRTIGIYCVTVCYVNVTVCYISVTVCYISVTL